MGVKQILSVLGTLGINTIVVIPSLGAYCFLVTVLI